MSLRFGNWRHVGRLFFQLTGMHTIYDSFPIGFQASLSSLVPQISPLIPLDFFIPSFSSHYCVPLLAPPDIDRTNSATTLLKLLCAPTLWLKLLSSTINYILLFSSPFLRTICSYTYHISIFRSPLSHVVLSFSCFYHSSYLLTFVVDYIKGIQSTLWLTLYPLFFLASSTISYLAH